MWVYMYNAGCNYCSNEDVTWVVGFFVNGDFILAESHGTQKEARDAVNFLNGGNVSFSE